MTDKKEKVVHVKTKSEFMATAFDSPVGTVIVLDGKCYKIISANEFRNMKRL